MKDARCLNLEGKCRGHAGNQVTLPSYTWDPEAVNHIRGLGEDYYRGSDRNMNFICRVDRMIRLRVRVVDLPPPLVPSHLNGDCTFLRGFLHAFLGNNAQ